MTVSSVEPPRRAVLLRRVLSEDRLFDVLAAAACALALWVALHTVSGLRWPYDGDHYRDIAQAQVARDGHPLSDPFYAGEWVWYNPLVPWLIGLVSLVARVPPAQAHVQSGPWMNLLAPVAFYILCTRLAGQRAAFAALVIFLFFNCRTDPALTCPTYSPWLFVATFAQGLFFLTLLAMVRASDQPSPGRAALVGLLAGLTFLAHTGPALILAAVALFLLPRRALALCGVVAFAVASPFLISIAGHYRLHIVNAVPTAWSWLPVTLAGFPGTLRANAFLLASAVAGALVVRSKPAAAWAGVSLALTAYGLSRDAFHALPAIVPTFHFWRYAMAAFTMFAGATAAWACRLAARRYGGWLLAGAAVALVIWYLPHYRSRFDLTYGQSIAASFDPNQAAVTSFLHKSTPPDAVVLGTRGASLLVIGPAGRRVVAVNANWSNPYVDDVQRVADRERMLELLKAHDASAFRQLANEYRVSHVVGVGPEECDAMRGPEVQLIYTFGNLCVFGVR
jgi:hypothetical protein